MGVQTVSRILDFFDGFSSATQPIINFITAGKLAAYSSESAYVTDKGDPADESDIFWDTTEKIIKIFNGTSWEPVGGTLNMINEVPSGLINGVNQLYITTQQPLTDHHLAVWHNGVKLKKSEYTVSGNDITIGFSPEIDAEIDVWYITDDSANPFSLPDGTWMVVKHEVTAGEVTAEQLTISPTPQDPTNVDMQLRGAPTQSSPEDYLVSGDQLQWGSGALAGVIIAGDKIVLKYFA